MIDLRNRGLPNAIEVDGKSFLIKTDFREWLKFGEIMKNKNAKFKDLFYLFENEIPETEFINELMDFYINPNATPQTADSKERVIDYILDGEYLVGSFQQAYGIDLTTCEMHWHRFKALIACLPSNTKMAEIMQMRGWKQDTTKYETQCRKLRDMWALPREKVDDDLMDEINAEFYGAM